ncbi:aspartic peptidase domain-containing protein [Russula emetica]|nr:aspartic peptidase domain-containing protein [Russula emetica]
MSAGKEGIYESERDEGPGGSAGMVLPLNMVGAGMYEAVYTAAVQVGSNGQNFSLQVDTGSSDLWIASTSCSSTACSGTKGRQYDPSISGVSAQSNFSIQYLAGNVSGPVYWDEVDVGGYSISSQALAAATSVESEPLEHEFNGILGLALPSNSLIAQSVTPVSGSDRNGASFASNLFDITAVESAPSSRFFSLTLSRPGSSAIPSQLGIGQHPSQLVPDPSRVNYSPVVLDPSRRGTPFWELQVSAITLYVNSSRKSVNLDAPRSGNALPTAILDSGVPSILATSDIANGIYGSLGIGPASDGQYYVPCTTPLNMTITLNGYPEMPLHPLDLTTQSQTNPSSSNCVGLIQTDGGVMDTSPSVSDMILGLLSLTNATRAMQEFHNVRVLNEPLSSGDSSSPTSATPSRKLSVGVDVLLALLSIIVACVALFGLRWFYVRRRLRKGLHTNTLGPKPTGAMTTVNLALGMSPGLSIAGDSARTMVGQGGAAVDEFGLPKHKDDYGEGDRVVSYLNLDPGDPSGWRDTLVGSTVDFPNFSEPASAFETAMLASDEPLSSTRDAALAAAAVAGLPMHRHNAKQTGVVEPLLSYTAQHARVDSTASFGANSARSFRPNGYSVDDDLAEFGVGRESMAGVGTAARSSRIRARHGGDSSGSVGSISLASVGGPGHAPRPSFDGRFPGIAPAHPPSLSGGPARTIWKRRGGAGGGRPQMIAPKVLDFWC